MAPAGEILSVRDEGTIWQIFYQIDGDGVGVVNFDWRLFAQMYESETGLALDADYQSTTAVRDHFRGRRIRVDGEPFHETVSFLEDQPVDATRMPRVPVTPRDFLRRYPRICAHIICHSLGYASPTTAASILMHGHRREPDYCEWIWSCYGTNAKKAVDDAIAGRHSHRGFMADFDRAYSLVQRAVDTGDEPLFGSWF